MSQKKINCWEFKKCGREPGGLNASSLGVCPVPKMKKLNGIHGGENAGRTCWVVGGSLCKGNVQGSFATKYRNCEKCDFFTKVRGEEFHDFQSHVSLLSFLYV